MFVYTCSQYTCHFSFLLCSTATKLKYFSDYKHGISIPARGESSDLLNAEGEKNDYDWSVVFLLLVCQALHIYLGHVCVYLYGKRRRIMKIKIYFPFWAFKWCSIPEEKMNHRVSFILVNEQITTYVKSFIQVLLIEYFNLFISYYWFN